ncbi:MAG: restriction endonuclease subunit S, partial [Planctomyces sp.]
TLNFPTSSEADLVAESPAAETSTKSGAKNRRKRTADFADDTDKHNESQCDSSAISAQSAVKIDAPQIPNGWCWTTFKDATVNFDGQRVPIKKEDRDRRAAEYPYYGASGVIDDIDDFLFDGEFLLVAEDGANLLSRSTPIAFRASGKFWVNNHAHVVQPANGVALRFIEHYLNSIDLKFFVSGSAQPKLNQANLNKIPIPLPSLPEQHRIVAEIEKQFTRLD